MNHSPRPHAAAAVCLLLALLSGCQTADPCRRAKDPACITFDNAWFYDKDGKFLVERGKDAYIALMAYHGYPVFPDIRDMLWVSDYGTGEFTRLGLGAIMPANVDGNDETVKALGKDAKDYRFMLQDLFLLPGQMLPEHYHLATDAAAEKMEGWFVRHGSAWIIGEGPETPGIKTRMPAKQRPSATVFHAADDRLIVAGEFRKLNRILAHHSQLAGPEGVIESEVANFHDNNGVRHQNTTLVFP
jgi:D-lyxose ketol-isomerase